MFIVNPTLSWVSLAIFFGFYWLLLRRQLKAPFADVRSGLFVAVAEWAATKVSELPRRQERAWKPNLLVPVESAAEVRGMFDLLTDIAYPKGTIKVAGIARNEDPEAFGQRLEDLAYAFRERNVFASCTVIDAGGDSFAGELIASMQALRGAFFRPNILFLRMPESDSQLHAINRILSESQREDIGALIFAPHPMSGLGRRKAINVWIRDRSPDWRISWDIGNLDLSILTALKLKRNWDAEMRLIMTVEREEDRPNAGEFLSDLVGLARLPNPGIVVEVGRFGEFVGQAPEADIHVFGLTESLDVDFVNKVLTETRSSCLFVRDSGHESALA